jgi:cytochrome d ubiquinol oxidase subunit II
MSALDPYLPTLWFLIVGVLFAGYAILDGFDLGVGCLHLWVRKDEHRRLFLNSIGPVWDGNEVWLVTGGGALFAAFPVVYAAVFSGFYLAFILLLFALIFRAVAIEFRSKHTSPAWRTAWDISFSASSILASVLIGVAMGNIIQGIPLDDHQEYTGGFFNLLSPYALFTGVTTAALFAMHGGIYLAMKTEGELHEIVRRWAWRTILVFLGCYFVFNLWTLIALPHVREILAERPGTAILLILNVLLVLAIPRELYHKRDFRAFLCSAGSIALLMGLFAAAMYPNIVFSSQAPTGFDLNQFTLAHNPWNLTIDNARSTDLTLGNMLIIAAIGVPIVLAYTVGVYWIFRGKVKLNQDSY